MRANVLFTLLILSLTLFIFSGCNGNNDSADGDTTDGDVADGDAGDGDTTDGDVTDGDVADGDVADGDVADGDVTDGDTNGAQIVDECFQNNGLRPLLEHFGGEMKDLVVQGNNVFAATENGLVVFDISNPSKIEIAASLPQERGIYNLVADENYLYALDGFLLYIYDISDSANVFKIGEIRLADRPYSNWQPSALALHQSYVITSGARGINIIDVSNPAEPVDAGNFVVDADPEQSSDHLGICIIGDVGYTIIDQNLVSFDLSDVENPTHLSHVELQYSELSDWEYRNSRMANQGSILFITDNTRKRLLIYNVSNPSALRLEAQLDLDLDGGQDIFVSGKYAFLASGRYGVTIVDIENPSDPMVVSTDDGVEFRYILDIEVKSDLALLLNEHLGVQAVNIADIKNPVFISNCDIPEDPRSVVKQGDTLYIADGYSGFVIMNIENPAAPKFVGTYVSEEYTRNTEASRIHVSDGIAYLGYYEEGLEIVDVSNPSEPRFFGRFDYEVEDMVVSGKRAYLNDNFGLLATIDISDPANPSLLGKFEHEEEFTNLLLSNSLLFTTTYEDKEIRVWDPTNPVQMTMVGKYESGFDNELGELLEVIGATAFMVGEENPLVIIDFSIPEDPKTVAKYEPELEDPNALLISDSKKTAFLFSDEDDDQLEILDISNIQNIKQVGMREIAKFAPDYLHPEAYGKTMIIPGGYDGLHIYTCEQ